MKNLEIKIKQKPHQTKNQLDISHPQIKITTPKKQKTLHPLHLLSILIALTGLITQHFYLALISLPLTLLTQKNHPHQTGFYFATSLSTICLTIFLIQQLFSALSLPPII